LFLVLILGVFDLLGIWDFVIWNFAMITVCVFKFILVFLCTSSFFIQFFLKIFKFRFWIAQMPPAKFKLHSDILLNFVIFLQEIEPHVFLNAKNLTHLTQFLPRFLHSHTLFNSTSNLLFLHQIFFDIPRVFSRKFRSFFRQL
jgi:hypothetical protein